jgi:septal ring factor EnvC (AmiA/AmiB activator)
MHPQARQIKKDYEATLKDLRATHKKEKRELLEARDLVTKLHKQIDDLRRQIDQMRGGEVATRTKSNTELRHHLLHSENFTVAEVRKYKSTMDPEDFQIFIEGDERKSVQALQK